MAAVCGTLVGVLCFGRWPSFRVSHFRISQSVISPKEALTTLKRRALLPPERCVASRMGCCGQLNSGVWAKVRAARLED